MNTNIASPNLFLFVAMGKHIPKCELTCRKSGEGQKDYLKVYFEEVVISSYQIGGGAGGELSTDQISFNFTKIKFEYSPQDSKGNVGKAVTAGWDVKQNVKSG